mmetsp:Transcript_41809/g.48261  ORF Transcript_41809/g.48261 Transcript_41809/m.48261 type:complete len:285 (-) Transcript_41809:60-914(-)
MAALADERTPLVPSLTKSSSNGTTTITNTTTSTPQMIIKKFYSKFVPAFIGIITVFALLFFYAGLVTANTIDTAKNNSSGTIVSMSTISSLNPIPSPNASPSLNPTSSSPSLSLSPSASLLNSTSSPSPSNTSQTELDFILTITTPASSHQSTTTVYIGPPLSNTPTTATDDGPSSSSSLNTTSISTTAPTLSSPTATTDILCVDDLLEYKGKAKYNCHWVGKGHKKKRKKKCKQRKNFISNICRETCGTVGVGPCHFLHKNKGKVELYKIEETTYYVVKEGKQ